MQMIESDYKYDPSNFIEDVAIGLPGVMVIMDQQ